jgi:hypothetical protein
MLAEVLAQHGSAPVVIGGTGGSGTRLIARLLREIGVDLGTRVNEAEDALAFVPLYDRYVNAYLESGSVDPARFASDLLQSLRDHGILAGRRAWGWKNPRSIYLLPLLDGIVPALRFVHVVRDGIDMATSGNRNQLVLHGRALLGPAAEQLPEALRAALLWKAVNERAADYGAHMPERYFLLRYEDVCADPGHALAAVAASLGLDLPANGWMEPIKPVAGRGAGLAPELLSALRARIGDALERFGYRC